LRFFDHWLKGIDNSVMEEPPVKLAIRTGGGSYHFRHEHEWPLARTRWTRLYLDLSRPEGDGIAGMLTAAKPQRSAARSYSASGASHAGHASASSSSLSAASGAGLSFMSAPLEEDTEITGPL